MTFKQNLLRAASSLMALAVVAAACTTPEAETASTTEAPTTTAAILETTTTAATVEANFAFVEHECRDLGLAPDVDVTCGSVTVPANWETEEGEFNLEVAILATTSENPPAADPLVYLDGGPGSHTLDTMQFRMDDFYLPLTERSEVIVFDQRGTGRSEPVASCVEVTELTEAEQASEEKRSATALSAAFVDALADCSSRLRADGVPIDDLNTANNAKDVDAIRQALGYRTWNLLGISYGTRLGLEVAAQFPDTVRSLILDSVFPPQVDSAVANSKTFGDSYDAVVAACAAEEACAAQGDLGARFEAAVAALEEEPMEVDLIDFNTGQTSSVFVDGDALLGLMNSSLYSAASFTDFPELLTGIENGDNGPLSLYATVDAANADFLSVGMHLGIMCAEEYSFSNPEAVLAATQPDPFGLVPAELAANATFDQCEAFTSATADSSANEAITSDVPTLVMAGDFDPVTPTAWGVLAAETLTQSQTVVFPGRSHGVSPTDCGLEIVSEFLNDPTSVVNQDCAEEYVPVFIPTGEFQPIEFDERDVTFSGVQATTVVPQGWTNRDDGSVVSSRRGLSLLDSTEMLQIATTAQVVNGLTTNLGLQLGGTFVDQPSVNIDGNEWSVKSMVADDIKATVYLRSTDTSQLAVYMFSSAAEHDGLVETALQPTAAGFVLR